MPNIKQFCRLCHLSLLRLRVAYAAGAVYRMSRRFRMLYDASLSRAFWKLSLWDNAYQEQKQRYLAAQNRGEL